MNNLENENLHLQDGVDQKAFRLQDQYFDLRGLSLYSGLAVPTLRDYLRLEGLPHYRLKGKILIKRSEFDKWMEKFRANHTEDLDGLVEKICGDFIKK